MESWAAANEEQARYRDGGEAAHWLAYEERYARVLASFAGYLLTAAAIGRVGQVAGVGCGTGSTTRAAGRAAVDGEALDLGLPSAMPRQAARRARPERLGNAGFEHGDAPVHRFTPGAGDVALSHCGVMFFAGPAAAFAAIGRGLRRGGRLVFVRRQNLAGNESIWTVVPGSAAACTWRSRLVTRCSATCCPRPRPGPAPSPSARCAPPTSRTGRRAPVDARPRRRRRRVLQADRDRELPAPGRRPADGRPGQRGRPGRARTVPRPGWPAAGIAGMARHREQALAVKQVVIAAIVSHFGHPRGHGRVCCRAGSWSTAHPTASATAGWSRCSMRTPATRS